MVTIVYDSSVEPAPDIVDISGVPPIEPPIGSSDFDTRKNAPGVVRWFDYDSPEQLGSKTYGANFGTGPSETMPVLDTTTKCSGASSLRFDIPSERGADATVCWMTNFSPDLATQFGENSEFYIQVRQRFNQAMIDTGFEQIDGSGQGGIKQIMIGTGDQPPPWNMNLSSSCSDLEVVAATYYQNRTPCLYNQCGKSAGLYENVPPYDQKLQNAMPEGCLYSEAKTGDTSGCFSWVADEWMTFQIGITLGPRDDATNTFKDSTVRFWGAREGQPSTLIVDWHPGVPGYFPLYAGTSESGQKFGKVWLVVYMTQKSPTQVHPVATTWFDELIISTKRIADPSEATITPPIPGDYPAWRRNKPVGEFFEIAGTANMNGAFVPEPPVFSIQGIIDTWNGLAAGPESWWSVAAGGHGIWQQAALKIALNVDAPQFVCVNPGSAFADAVLDAPYYKDKLPVSRHTYDQTQFITKTRDGIPRVMLFSVCAPYGTGTPGGFQGGPQVDGFRITDGRYDPPGTWEDMLEYQQFASIAKHPITEDVYATGGYTSRKWTAATGAWTEIVPTTGTVTLFAWDQFPSLVDVSRNRLVGAIDRRPYTALPMLQFINLTTYEVTLIEITGAITAMTQGAVLVHDEDADRYILFQNGPVYVIDPTTGVSTLLTTVPAAVYSVVGKAAYFKSLGGIAYLPRYSSNIMFMPTRA